MYYKTITDLQETEVLESFLEHWINQIFTFFRLCNSNNILKATQSHSTVRHHPPPPLGVGGRDAMGWDEEGFWKMAAEEEI